MDNKEQPISFAEDVWAQIKNEFKKLNAEIPTALNIKHGYYIQMIVQLVDDSTRKQVKLEESSNERFSEKIHNDFLYDSRCPLNERFWYEKLPEKFKARYRPAVKIIVDSYLASL